MKLLKNYLESIQIDETMSGNINPGIEFPNKQKVLNYSYNNESNDNFDYIFNNSKKRIMIDFDGVIHNYDKGYNNGILSYPNNGVKDFINKLKTLNYEIVIFTTRLLQKDHNDFLKIIEKIKNWLDKNNIYYDNLTYEKWPALAYIDDRGISFNYNDTSWDSVLEQIKKLKNISL